jgi:DNA-binding transcriptional LysR family regulator
MNHHHLVYLPYFVRAAKLGNFSAVARELGVSAVAVSKNIAALEATLGVRLFQRSTRSVSLTADGLCAPYWM